MIENTIHVGGEGHSRVVTLEGEHDRVERVYKAMEAAGIREVQNIFAEAATSKDIEKQAGCAGCGN